LPHCGRQGFVGGRTLKEFDFSLFTDRQLGELARQLTAEFVRRREAAKRLVKRRGGLLEAAPPRYVNPENPAQTWSGRGRQPAWVAAAIAGGASLESLLVDDDCPTERT
jgi:DNA-binding protein H-NS